MTIYIPISYYEATTFYFFVNQGLIQSISYYPAPNNHILYSTLSSLVNLLPFNKTLELRLTSVLTSLSTIILIHHIIFKLFDKKTAIVACVVFISLPGFLLHSFIARGYSLTVFFFVLGFYSTIKLNSNRDNFYYCLFIISSILGLYTIPSYLYAIIPLNLFFLFLMTPKSQFKVQKKWIISNFIICFFTFLLYLPVLYRSGIESIIGNRFVKPISTQQVINSLYNHFNSTLNLILKLDVVLFLIIIFLAIIFILSKKSFNLNVRLALFSLLLSPFILIIHSVIPFERTWLYLVFPVIIIFCSVFYNLNELFKRVSFLILLIIGSVSIFSFTINHKKKFSENFTAKKISESIILGQFKSMKCSSDIINRTIHYNLEQQKYECLTGVGEINESEINSNKIGLFISQTKWEKNQKKLNIMVKSMIFTFTM